jgi:enoyl-CoA hydratase/carnithine racemase
MSLADLQHMKWETQGAVGVLTLNRPGNLNALNKPALEELSKVVVEATHNEEIRSVVLTGAGRAFCAGADIQEWSDATDNTHGEPWPPRMHTVMSGLYWMPKPVIAAVNGVAVGAGCDLTLVADMRFASTQARFGEVYMRLGFCPDAGGSFLLPRIVGEARAAEMIYTGRIVEADEADRIGLVTEVVEPDELMKRAVEQAHVFASGPTVGIGIAKQNIRTNYTLSFEEALRNELRGGELCAKTEDHREGLRAAVDKRPPEFVGR